MIAKVTFDDRPTRVVKVWQDIPPIAVTGLPAALTALAALQAQVTALAATVAGLAAPSDIANGTYTVGLGFQTGANGTLTFVGGRITGLTQAS